MNSDQIVRALTRTIAALLVLAVLLWPLDWFVWRARVAAGGGLGSVVVTHYTVASLKGNKEEYYFEGTGPAECSRSLFPHGDDSACWWLHRHPEVVERF